MFNTYAQAINKAHQRTGSLFEHPFHRKVIQTKSYFLQLIPYIHRNPQTHGFVKDFRDWPHSSYYTMLTNGATKLKRDETLGWFGSKEKFIEAHNNTVIEPWLLEQDFD